MSKENSKSIESVLKHVDQNRRGFLGKILAGSAAVAAIPAMTTLAFGQEEGGKGKSGKGKSGEGKGGEGKGKGGEGKGKGGRPDPADMADRLIKEFDKDGDDKLDKAELTKALTALMRMRGGGGRGGRGGEGKGGQGRGGEGKGKGGEGKGKGGRPERDDA